jgi:hypothetical protein
LRQRALWAFAVLLSLALLLAPALWNGFALLQYDTGGYLAPWYDGRLHISRSVPYGLLLVAGQWPDFWPVLFVQSALTVWLLALILRAHGLGNRPLLLLAMVAVLCLITTLPWLTAILLTDIFAGLGVLALYLLLLRDDTLNTGERTGLLALVAVSAATHSATLVVLLGLLIVAATVRLVDAARIPSARLARAIAGLLLAGLIVIAANWLVAGQLGWTPGGVALSFGRMLEDGIVKQYLDDHCPDPNLRLCADKGHLPRDADDFFWGEGVFDRLGRFDGFGDEMRRIALASLADYPALQVKSIAGETAKQVAMVETGAGVVNWIWNTYDTIKAEVPAAAPAMLAARQQQRGGISFERINRFQVPVAWLTMALLPFITVLAWRRPGNRDIAEFAATTTLAILGNAVVFGALATAHNRYGARIVWIAALAGLVAAARIMSSRRGGKPPGLLA